jgi:putative restriction endonuclease
MESTPEPISYWFLKSVSDEEINYKSNDGYKDEIETKYVYDSDVANHKNIKTGDIAVIADKEKVLGLAKISRILISNGKKERRRCPDCEKKNSTYDIRKNITPKYRCNKGHEFDEPASEIVEITTFQAFYKDSFRFPNKTLTVDKIRPYFHKNYNQNMSMQSLSEAFFTTYFKEELKDLDETFVYPSAEEANRFFTDLASNDYVPNEDDERGKIFKEIMQRRGQKSFRDAIRKAYGDKCMITGCEVLEVLEAAHINPYKGEKDNHVANGLLLRSDIHTLFDLDLIGIDPEKLTVHLSGNIQKEEYKKLNGKKLELDKKARPSKSALGTRWTFFINKLS